MDSPVEADLVVGVPESGNAAALGYSLQSGIPYGTAFVKNSYIGRTFIKPKQSNRESSVQVKLNVLKEAVNGKRVIMIDDSIVRGTTSDRIVKMLRDAGATEVHMRVSSPPFLYPCYFGTDVPACEQLIAYNRSVEEIRQIIGADSLAYLELDRLKDMVEDFPAAADALPENIRWIRRKRIFAATTSASTVDIINLNKTERKKNMSTDRYTVHYQSVMPVRRCSTFSPRT